MTVDLPPERQTKLWSEFIDSYGATTTRPAVDLFLLALLGRPRQPPAE